VWISDRLWASFIDLHHPFDCPEPWASLHPAGVVDLPPERKSDLDRQPWWHPAVLEGEPKLDDPILKRFTKSGTQVLAQTDERLREMTANYLGMISLIDHRVDRLVAALAERHSSMEDVRGLGTCLLGECTKRPSFELRRICRVIRQPGRETARGCTSGRGNHAVLQASQPHPPPRESVAVMGVFSRIRHCHPSLRRKHRLRN